MKIQKSIESVFDESSLNKEISDSYLHFLQSSIVSSDSDINTPWFVKIITVIGAWFSSLLFLGFLFFAKILQSEESLILSGAIFTVTGTGLTFINKRNHFLDSFSLSLSLLGQTLLGFGIGIKYQSLESVSITGLIVEPLIFLCAMSYTQKFISIILIPICLLGILWNSSHYELITILTGALSIAATLFWLNELPLQITLKKHPLFFVPTAYGLVISLLLLTAISIDNSVFESKISHWYISSIISFLAFSMLLYKTLYRDHSISGKTFWAIIISTGIILAPTIQSPGIITSVLIITLGFARSNRVLMTIGILFLSFFIISFYYSMQQTLLIKSILLMSTGFLFLGIYFLAAMTKKRIISYDN